MLILNRLRRRYVLSSLVLSVVVLLGVQFLPLYAFASSQSFNVLNSDAQPGMLMSLTSNAGVVTPASDKNSSSLIGVLSTGDVTFDQQPGQVSVQTDGAASALVSTLNGDILVGDRIATSSLVGFGAKAITPGWIVGVAQGSLDSKTTGAISSNITDSQGKQHKVYVARIPVAVKVTYYNVVSVSSTSTLQASVQSTADSIAGKHASTIAIVLSFLLLAIGVILASVLLYSAVRGGLSAVARQPLTKKFVSRKVIQAFGVALAILVSVIIGALIILKLF